MYESNIKILSNKINVKNYEIYENNYYFHKFNNKNLYT